MTDELRRTLLVIEPSPQAPRNSEGALIELGDGRLCLAYSRFTGGGHDNSAADIAARVSGDGGRTWSDDSIIVANEGRENVMSVSLLRTRSGEVLLFYAIKNGWDDCRLYVRRSDDEFKTLGEKVCVTDQAGYHVVNNDRVVQLSSGRLVAPAALHPASGDSREAWSPRGISMCFLSEDQGRTWRRSTGTLEAPLESRSGLQEPGVVELLDGRVYMWMRTDMGCQFQSFSQDGGETWSEAQPSPMASPVSPASIRRCPWTGELLLVWNDHSGAHPFPRGKRTPLCAAISSDEARSWKPSKPVEDDPDGWYCYTLMTFVGESVILGYCAGDPQVGGLNRLKLTQIHRDWLWG